MAVIPVNMTKVVIKFYKVVQLHKPRKVGLLIHLLVANFLQ